MKHDDQQLLLYWSGELEPQQRAEFEQRLKCSPELQLRLSELEQLPLLKPDAPSPELVTDAITAYLLEKPVETATDRTRKKTTQAAVTAMLTALILAGMMLILMERRSDSPSQQMITSATQELKSRLEESPDWAKTFNQRTQTQEAKPSYHLGASASISDLRERMSAVRQRIQTDPI
ncbi:MAG: hypothetical protein AAGH72_05450 [Verrucomicrobiota bacterium]